MTGVIEGNRLIAEFMGWKSNLYSNLPNRMHRTDEKSVEWATAVENLNYHTSWDWLMPVVEKIEAIEDEHHGHFGVYINSNGCSIQATNLRTDKPLANPPHYYNEVIGETKISSTWQAVVQFIQWYNENQNQ